MSRWNPFAASQWIAWIGATVAACMVMTFTAMAYAHKTFITHNMLDLILMRLDRIETKLDKTLWRGEDRDTNSGQRRSR